MTVTAAQIFQRVPFEGIPPLPSHRGSSQEGYDNGIRLASLNWLDRVETAYSDRLVNALVERIETRVKSEMNCITIALRNVCCSCVKSTRQLARERIYQEYDARRLEGDINAVLSDPAHPLITVQVVPHSTYRDRGHTV